MNVWRLTINTAARDGVDPRRFCFERKILGVGWPVDEDGPLDWGSYERLGTEKYYPQDNGWWPALNAIGNRMREGDLCWSRDRSGCYYLGRVDGPWEYQSGGDYRAADVVNVRSCRWVRMGAEDSVPGKVLNSLRASRTLQAVHDDSVRIYSMLAYNQAAGKPVYEVSAATGPSDLFALVSPEDCEDILGVYLQEVHGYRLIPSTRRRDTFKTEFVLRKPGSKALVQVKQGDITLDRGDFAHDHEGRCEWFLLSTGGSYEGDDVRHVHCLDPDTLRDFAVENVELMSDRVRRMVEFCDRIGRASGSNREER
ncbi:MAG: hypothetical protein OYL41_13275 [Acidobacteriota bacterium]|nr:hypothetical protein [Acidobacteriota bacterium]